MMEHHQQRRLTFQEKWRIVWITGLFAMAGAAMGAVAYFQRWLG